MSMSDQKAITSEQEMQAYRVQGFTCANCAGKFEKNVKRSEERRVGKEGGR